MNSKNSKKGAELEERLEAEAEEEDDDAPGAVEELRFVPTFMRTFRNRPFTILLGAQLLAYINPLVGLLSFSLPLCPVICGAHPFVWFVL